MAKQANNNRELRRLQEREKACLVVIKQQDEMLAVRNAILQRLENFLTDAEKEELCRRTPAAQ